MFKQFPGEMNFLETATPQKKFRAGIFMWGLLFLAYFVFCLNWLIMSKFEGSESEGWTKAFLNYGLGGSKEKAKAITESSMYSVSFARGISAIAAAWIMVKLTHKWSVVIALFLNTMALPLIFAPHFSLFLIGRILMGFGGTMVIIYVQPVLAKFFNLRYKGYLSILTPAAYLLASLLIQFIFLSSDAKSYLLSNWQSAAAICSVFSFVPLLLYPIVGKNFHSEDSHHDEHELEQSLDNSQNSYLGVAKQSSTIFWVIWYSFLLVVSLMVSWVAPKIIKTTNVEITKSLTGVEWESIYTMLFYIGALCGLSLGKWNKLEYQRKPFIVAISCIGALAWLLILGVSLLPVQAGAGAFIATLLIFAGSFVCAFFLMGAQSIILYIPHEYKENANHKRSAIFYSLLWGGGYIIFGIYQIIVDLVRKNKSLVNADQQLFTGEYLALTLITLFIVLYVLFSTRIKESRPEFVNHPKLEKMCKFLSNKPEEVVVER